MSAVGDRYPGLMFGGGGRGVGEGGGSDFWGRRWYPTFICQDECVIRGGERCIRPLSEDMLGRTLG